MSDLLDVDEAAARLRCSRRRVFELLADGTLARGPKYGRQTVITVDSVEAALAPSEQAPATLKRRTRPSKPFKAELDAMLERRAARRQQPASRGRAQTGVTR